MVFREFKLKLRQFIAYNSNFQRQNEMVQNNLLEFNKQAKKRETKSNSNSNYKVLSIQERQERKEDS